MRDRSLKHYQIRVSGRVQGVFFRASTVRVATELGVNGWVKNEADGSVLISAEADEHQLEKLVEWCHQGPAHAKVTEVVYRETELAGHHGFTILR